MEVTASRTEKSENTSTAEIKSCSLTGLEVTVESGETLSELEEEEEEEEEEDEVEDEVEEAEEDEVIVEEEETKCSGRVLERRRQHLSSSSVPV